MTGTLQTPIRDLVARDFRAARLLERRGIDFCCRGAQSLDAGCRAAGVDGGEIARELDALLATPASGAPRFQEWDLGVLAAYIVDVHHTRVREMLPALSRHARKTERVHGGTHPELARVAALVEEIGAEMTAHMMKEEQILFPYIAALERAAAGSGPTPVAPFGTIEHAIRMMEREHESSGDAMAEIRQLTDGYRPPAGACATYRVCLQELEAFETDLHTHVHLENNILFPRAVTVEAALASRRRQA
jgi:regulator of cell morphogenesis and NO signaling